MASKQASYFGAFARNLVDIFGNAIAYANETAARIANQKGIPVTTIVSVTNATGVLLAANPKRLFAQFINRSATVTAEITGNAASTTAVAGTNTIAIPPGGVFTDDFSFGAWNAITAASTAAVSVYEVTAP